MYRRVATVILPILLLAAQIEARPPEDRDLRVSNSEELRAAEQRDRKRLATILRICRDAVRKDDMVEEIRRFADSNGLSTYARLVLTMDCRLYQQGLRDGRQAGKQ